MAERQDHARRLVGLRLSAVRYLTLDYRRWDLAPEFRGPRTIADTDEWAEPTWEFAACDSIDVGVELETTDNRTFSVTWDALGYHESIGLLEQPLLGWRFDEERDIAIWEVASRSRWRTFLNQPVEHVELHYLRWADEGFWCPRITLSFDSRVIELLLGDGREGDGVGPASDNVAVLFDPAALPAWERSSDLW